MREILFRGKRLDNGEWAEGYLGQDTIIGNGNTWLGYVIKSIPKKLWDCDWFEIDPTTIGQYTGLKDRSGRRIFEGDILEYEWKFGDTVVSREIYVVTFLGGAFGTERYAHGKRKNNCIPFTDNEFGTNERHCEIIGNIHDNPDLLKDGE